MNMLEILSQFKPEVIVAGGTTLALIYLIYSNIKRDQQWNKLLANHFYHDTEAKDKLTATLQKLIDVINEFRK